MKKIICFVLTVAFLFGTMPAYCASGERMKGVWISTVYNLDFPKSPTADSNVLKAEIDEIVKNCADMGFNAVFLQVRPSSDAIYPSEIYPWSRYLCGVQGKAPSDNFDPLEYWVKKCHMYSIDIHAWINPYRVTKGGAAELAELSADNPAAVHPDWIVQYSDGNYYYNPAIPEVRQLVADGVRELLENYEIDGIHMDDYFYPGPDFDDDAQYQLYNGGEFSTIADWRRNNVNMLVRSLHETVHSVRSDAVFGISPLGIWDNKSSNALGSDTSGKSSYSALFADSKKWVEEGWVDYLAPQIYWEFGFKAADYGVVSQWWSNVFKDSEVKLYIGLADYRCTNAQEDSVWYGGAEIERQMDYNLSDGAIDGEIHFRYKMLNENPALKRIISEKYKSSGINVLLDGKKMSFTHQPVITENTTLVPMRAIFEALGAVVDWEPSTNTVTAVRGSDVIRLKPGDNFFEFNNKKIELPVRVRAENGTTMVPLRAVSEALYCTVEWHGETDTVVITSREKQ